MTGMIGAVAAREAIDILVGNGPTLTNRFWYHEGWTNQTLSIRFNRTLRVWPAVEGDALVTTLARQATQSRTSSAVAPWSLPGVPRP